MSVVVKAFCKQPLPEQHKLIGRKVVECSALRYQIQILKNRIATLEEDLTASKNLLSITTSNYDILQAELERLVTDSYVEATESDEQKD